MPKSKLVLGTVQLGLSYGVANVTGQPSDDEAFSILDAAFADGINTFDTAAAYGSTEEVLGSWIRARNHVDQIFIISKTKAEKPIEEEIEKSLARLGVDHLDGYLLHSPDLMHSEQTLKDLRRMKEIGKTHAIGVSIYEPSEALEALGRDIDYIQVPYNALDQRLDQNGFFDGADEKGVTVFARSPFLQGLLLMKPEDIPLHLEKARPYIESFIEIATRHDLSQLAAALIFAVHGRADHVVFGVEKKTQLTECLSTVTLTGHESFVEAIQKRFNDVDPFVVNPSLWNKK